MEDLRSLMACIDDISSKIPDGLYLEMANKMKRVHDHMSGNKPFHEDTFYYSDDDSELESEEDDDASDSDYEGQVQRIQVEVERLRDIRKLKDEIVGLVKQMHAEHKNLDKFDKVARRTDWTPIKRMTAFRKSQAIKQWCENNVSWSPGGEAGELVGCISTAAAYQSWTWKNLMENGLRTIVLEIGTEEEIIRAQRGFVYYDELSLKTLQKLPAFEKKIHDDYKEECQRKMTEYFRNAKLKVVESEKKMDSLELACTEREYILMMDYNVVRELRDYWNLDRSCSRLVEQFCR